MLRALALVLALAPGLAFAQDAVRVRGTVTGLEGSTLGVKTREGEEASIALGADWRAVGVTAATMADIKPGDFVGIASKKGAEDRDVALEVLIFPKAMAGTGEGSYPWDLEPESTMTNATVAESVTTVDGDTLTLSYKGESKAITVSDGTPIVTFGPATPADVKPGAVVFVPAMLGADGTLTAATVVVGTGGTVPPM